MRLRKAGSGLHTFCIQPAVRSPDDAHIPCRTLPTARLDPNDSRDRDHMAPHSVRTRLLSLAIASLAAGALLPSVSVAEEVQVGRYASVRPLPAPGQADLLAVIVMLEFPAGITTVGGAVTHLLERSGYRLAGGPAADPSQHGLLRLPLPAAHRALGPLPLRRALATLAGPAFALVEDPVHRLVAFELCRGDVVDAGPVARVATDEE